ncbi:acetamidase/formamidase family protein [Planomicrobium chinense]|uniref:acetamidase/formamidase family protein n=1 Tax=Planococcus chinensis TaxID=272917 RepID=UPI001CC7F11D|nr:acetamidase/formamidase family protein [Planococcus chinensis]MBZ5200042.1 acetamidase/formamidase family protein [Planococcus chinensis]MCP2033985.1 amidase [Planomicrobium sp. HSC-17F08]
MRTLPTKDVIYSFSSLNPPVMHAKPGETIVIETYDCFKNQIQSADQEVAAIDWNEINPATGPIFIEGADIGDLLKVTIDDLEIGNQGVMVTGPELGVMGHRMEAMESKIIPIQDGKAIFSDNLHLPLNPMIGVIGVAPEGKPVSCGTPGPHGGNMDTKLITKGATLYFPVFAEGALFALGDFHAAMGDGEVSVSGIEVPGRATVTFDVIKGTHSKFPILQNADGFAILVSAMTLDEAVKIAVEETIDFLLPHTDMTVSEMTMLMSAAGEAQISQVVDPLVTVRFFVPQHVLDSLGIQLFN